MLHWVSVAGGRHRALGRLKQSKALGRPTLIGLVGLAVLLTMGSGQALAQCTFAAGVDSCTGNLSGGIVTPSGTTTLNVFGVSSPGITPLAAVGIDFQDTTGASLLATIVTTPFGITTTGSFEGIKVTTSQSLGQGTGGIMLTTTGDINAGGDGIFAQTTNTTGSITVMNTGNINAGGDAIFARTQNNPLSPSGDAGAVAVTSIGNLHGSIEAISQGGSTNPGNASAVTVMSTGNISDGSIIATSTDTLGKAGAVTVTNTGNIGIGGSIRANSLSQSSSTGVVTVTSTGDIGGITDGIFATSSSTNGNTGVVTGAVEVNNTGDTGRINALSKVNGTGNAGAVTVTSTGSLAGEISAETLTDTGNAGAVTVMSNGNGGGIVAEARVNILGNAGAVTVMSTGNQSTGIVAKSDTLKGDAGPVMVTSIGNLGGIGPGQPSIDAESISSTSGNAGAVTVMSTGNVFEGILAASQGTTSNGNIEVDILGGTVQRSSNPSVWLQGGHTNILNNSGTILPGGSGIAVESDGAFLFNTSTINNSGTIIGNVVLLSPPGDNAFNNNVGALFAPGTNVFLNFGASTLTNAGTLSPGGVGMVQATGLTGNLIQTGTGTYAVDVNWAAPAADLIHVASGTAQLAGTVAVNLTTMPVGLHSQFTILHTDAAGDITNNGITPLNNTAAISYLLLFPNLQDMVLDATVNFAPGGLNPNQTTIGQNLNAIQAAGGSPAMSTLLGALMTLPTQQSLANALDQLSPEIYNYDLIETLYASQQFSNDLMSCRVAGEDGASFIREGQCIWARLRGRLLDLAHTSDNLGAKDTTWSFSSGIQFALGTDWRIGLAAGYDHINLDNSIGASSAGDRANVGGIIKYNPGRLLLAAGVTGGLASYNTTRSIAFDGFSAVLGNAAASSDEIDYVSGQLHAAYLFSQSNWYLKPLVDAAVTQLDLSSFSESGGNGAALTLPGRTDTVFSVSSGLEIGSQWGDDKVGVWRPFIRGGVTWQDTDHFLLDAGFLEAPQGVSPFFINTKVDQVLADVGAGVDFIHVSGAVLRLQYDGRFAQDTQLNSGSIKGSVPF